MNKKIISALLIAISVSTISVPAFAAEKNASTSSSSALKTAISSQGSTYDDDTAFETDAERAKRLANEAKSDNSAAGSATQPEKNIYGGYSSYQEYLNSLKASTLTSEQAAEGMTIIDGNLYSSEDAAGDDGPIIFGGVNPSSHTGYVSFKMDVPDGIHEVAYITVMNMNTYKQYGCNVYEANGWETQMCLPQGIYIISDAGLSADAASRYFADTRQFEVNSGSNNVIEFELLDQQQLIENQKKASDSSSSSATQTQITATTGVTGAGGNAIAQQNTTVKKGNIVSKLINVVIFTGIPLLVLFILYKKTKKKSHKHNGSEEL